MVNKKILVLGSKGLLGTEVATRFKKLDYDLTAGDIEELDITDEDKVSEYINDLEPDIVVNCAAYTNVEACEDEGYDIAKLVNGYAPGYIMKACQSIDAIFLHISTDYVDSNNDPDGFYENKVDLQPMNKYGETKLLGEREIQREFDESESEADFYIVRTQWLFGKGAQNFIAKITKYGKELEELKVVDDENGCPTYVKDLTDSIQHIIENSPDSGIYHVSSINSCSRFEFAKKILELQEIDTPVKRSKLKEWDRKAHISEYSILNNRKLPKHRTWEEMLNDFLSENNLKAA